MRKVALLLIFPACAAGSLWLAWTLAASDLRMALRGTSLPGQVVGMVLDRPESTDLLASTEDTITLTFKNGRIIRVSLRNRQLLSWTLDGTAQPIPTSPDPFYSTLAKAREAASDDAGTIRRLMRRESRVTTGEQIVLLERQEIAHGWVVQSPEITGYQFDASGNLQPTDSEASTAQPFVVTTRAVFEVPEGVSQKDIMISHERERNGRTEKPFRRDYYLFSEPYSTVQWPVFTYYLHGSSYVQRADLGKRGVPSRAFEIFKPCRVIHASQDPGSALLQAEPGPIEGEAGVLVWFGKYCEGIFTRWAYMSMVITVALALTFVSVLQISLFFKCRSISIH